ncbi:MAG: class I SAM-dependent methyltransferase [Nitrospinales bacterium]
MRKKINSNGFDTDKSQQYLNNYEDFFYLLSDKRIHLLELGFKNGGSLLMWRDYFEKGIIVGIDRHPIQIEDPSVRIHMYTGLQQDKEFLDHVCRESAPDGFDVIIDDCSHIGELTRISFWHLFNNHLKPGGIYVIEDWGTGYWDTYSDGRRFKSAFLNYRTSPSEAMQRGIISAYKRAGKKPFLKNMLNQVMIRIVPKKFQNHNFGMVGFIKSLVDECGIADITHQKFGVPPQRQSKFKKMQISHGQVFIVKASLS